MASPTTGYSCASPSPPCPPPLRYGQANILRSINVNDPSLISLVNKLQDVFSTVGVSISELIYTITVVFSLSD